MQKREFDAVREAQADRILDLCRTMTKPRTFFTDGGDPAACWPWPLQRNRKGYGRVRHDGRLRRAHRVAWELNNGPIPDGMHVLHKCDNPPCCNPAHLFIGTNAENLADCAAKDRTRFGVRHRCAKLTEADVRAIRVDGRSLQAIADDYGVSRMAIWQVLTGKTWRRVRAKQVAPCLTPS